MKGRLVLATLSSPETEPVEALLRQLAETRASLEQSEARYRRLMERIPAVVFELTPEGVLIEVNASIEETTGYSRAELVGQNWWQTFFPGQYQHDAQKLKQQLEAGDVSQYPVILVAKNGDLVPLELNTANEYGSDGRLVKVLGSAFNDRQHKPSKITETGLQRAYKDLETRVAERTAELHKANKRLETVLESLPVGVWIADATGVIVNKNDMSDQIWGGETPLSVGIEQYGEFVGWWADTGEQIETEEWALARALQKGEISMAEVIDILRYDGSLGTVLNSAVPIYDDEGNISGAVAINLDITHQRRLEHQADIATQEASRKGEELDAVFRAMTDALVVFDEQGILTSANPAAVKTYGFDPMGMHQRDLVQRLQLRYPDGSPIPYEDLPATRAMQGETVREERLTLTDPEGRQVLIVDSAAPLYDAKEQRVGAVVVWHDVTEREELVGLIHRERDTLETVLESIHEEVWVCDAAGGLIRLNAAARRTANLIGEIPQTVQDLVEKYEIVDEQDRPRPVEEAPLLRSLKGETIEGVLEKMKNPHQEEWVYRHVNSTPLLDKSGQMFGAVAVIRDVSHRKLAETLLKKHLSELEEQVQDRTRELADAYAELLAEIAERKQTEETLRQSEERFRLVIETIHDYAIFALDPEGHISTWNAGAEAIKGYRAEEIIGQHYSRFYTPEDVAEGIPVAALELAAARGRHEIESWRVKKDGTRFWANVIITALRDDSGSLRGFAKVVRDMTRRKEADEALRRQTGFVRLLQEVAVSANLANTVEEALLDTMRRVCRQQGWQGAHAFQVSEGSEDTVLRSMGLWNLPEGTAWQAFRHATEELSIGPSQGLPGMALEAGHPVWLDHLDVNERYIRRNAAAQCDLKTTVALPLMVGQKVVAILEFFSQEALVPQPDLLEVLMHIGTQLGRVFERQRSEEALRMSEARFRTIFENAPLGIELLRIGEGGLACNPALMRIMGEECGDLISDWLTHANRTEAPVNFGRNNHTLKPGTHELTEELSRGNRHSYRIELPLRRKDGSWLWGRLSVSLVLPTKDEQAPLAIAMLEDVSDRKQMEIDLAELKHRQMEGREMERLQLSQELHDGPMQDLYGISYNLQAYFEGLSGVADHQPIQEIQANLQQVVQTLRTICGELRPPTLAPFGLEKAIRSHADSFQGKYPHLVLGLDLMVDGLSLPSRTRLALYRIYQQALSNIVRHAKAKNVLVRLQMDSKEVRLEVVDDGQGFDLPQNWINLARQGNLGLLSAQERAEALGGYLQVESSAGSGTTIRAVVPRTNPGYSVWLDEDTRER